MAKKTTAPKTQDEMYPACRCIPKTCPDTTIDAALIKELEQNYRTLPSFEKTTYEQMSIKQYSLETNELLRCRWKEYKKQISTRVFAPFMFPSVRDLHFYNGSIVFNPALSIFRFNSQKFHLKPGPGVDHYGQMPIPDELYIKRGTAEKGGKKKENKKIKKAPKQKKVKIDDSKKEDSSDNKTHENDSCRCPCQKCCKAGFKP